MTDIITKYYVHSTDKSDPVELIKRAITQIPGCKFDSYIPSDGVLVLSGDVDPQSVCLVLTQTGLPTVVKSD